jgi:hypothetical protein
VLVDGVAGRPGCAVDRPLERRVAERFHLAAVAANQVVVMVAVGEQRLVAGDPVALPVAALNVLTAVLAAVTIAVSMRVVGILLIAALMVLPVIAAGRVAWSMASTVVLAMVVGLGSVLAGITIAYYADFPPGATTVLVATAAALVAMPLGALAR